MEVLSLIGVSFVGFHVLWLRTAMAAWHSTSPLRMLVGTLPAKRLPRHRAGARVLEASRRSGGSPRRASEASSRATACPR
jgi:hypothetical protein